MDRIVGNCGTNLGALKRVWTKRCSLIFERFARNMYIQDLKHS